MEFSQGWSTGQDKTGLDALLKLEFHLELAGTKQWAESPRPSQLHPSHLLSCQPLESSLSFDGALAWPLMQQGL